MDLLAYVQARPAIVPLFLSPFKALCSFASMEFCYLAVCLSLLL